MSLAGGAALTHSGGPNLADPAPDLPDRLNLSFDVCEHGSVAVPTQSLVDESPEHHLEADRPLEFDHRFPRKDPSTIQDRLGNHEQDSGLVLEHRTSQAPAGRDAAIAARRRGPETVR